MPTSSRASQRSFRFIHASDFHLDQPPGGLTYLPPDLISPLVEATYKSVDAVFDAAIRERVEFVVLSGDLIHFPTASPRAIDFLSTQFHRLHQKKIPVYWLGGKLEAGHGIPEDFRLPKNVHRMPTSRVQTLEVKQNKKTIAHIVGQSSGGNAYANLEDMRVPRDGRFFVGMWYCEGHEELPQDQLDELGIDYWAFGGVHQRRSLNNLIPAEYCGTPQGRLPSETGPHGCLLVKVTGDDIDETHFIETDAIRYRTEKIEVEPGDDQGKLIARMKSRMQTIRHDVDPKKPILVTWEVNDDGPLGRELRQLPTNEAFLETIRREADSKSQNVHSIALRSLRASVPSTLFDEDSILGDFLRVVRDLQQSGDATLDVRSYLPDTTAGRKLAESLHLESPGARQQLLREVTTMGIDWLSGDAAESEQIDIATQKTPRRESAVTIPLGDQR